MADHRSLPRCKETIDELELLAVMKKTVRTLESKEYLSDDADVICERYSELLKFLLKASGRVNNTTVQKAAQKVFESDEKACRLFGRAVVDAFSYIRGKAKRYVNGEKTNVSEAIMGLIQTAVLKSDSKSSSSCNIDTAMEAANERSSVRATAAAAAVATNPSTDDEILNLYGVETAYEAKRTLQVSHSLGGDSVVSVMSSPPTITAFRESPVRASVPLETEEARACVATVDTVTDLAVAPKDWLVI